MPSQDSVLPQPTYSEHLAQTMYTTGRKVPPQVAAAKGITACSKYYISWSPPSHCQLLGGQCAPLSQLILLNLYHTIRILIIILLHGLSSNGEKFGRELLETGKTSAGKTLVDLLPSARFIFPTAKWRRSSAFGRKKLPTARKHSCKGWQSRRARFESFFGER